MEAFPFLVWFEDNNNTDDCLPQTSGPLAALLERDALNTMLRSCGQGPTEALGALLDTFRRSAEKVVRRSRRRKCPSSRSKDVESFVVSMAEDTEFSPNTTPRRPLPLRPPCVRLRQRQRHTRRHPQAVSENDGHSNDDVFHPMRVSTSANSMRRFVCRFCDKGFGRKLHLEEHIRVHTGDQPYRCKPCGVSFTRKSALVRHERSSQKHIAQAFVDKPELEEDS